MMSVCRGLAGVRGLVEEKFGSLIRTKQKRDAMPQGEKMVGGGEKVT